MSPDRRDFLSSSLACGLCALCPLALGANTAAAPVKSDPVDIGKLSDYPKDGVSDNWAATHHFFVIRHKNRLYASSATCTHKAFDLVLDDGSIKCPQHGSLFSPQGKVQKGPARISLTRLGIRLSEGCLTVDPSLQFEEKKWNDPASYIPIDKAR